MSDFAERQNVQSKAAAAEAAAAAAISDWDFMKKRQIHAGLYL